MLRKCRRCSEQVETTDRICPNCGHDTVTGRPASSLKPPPPADDEATPASKTSVPTLILVLLIVLTWGFAGWQWFSANASAAPVYLASRAVESNLNIRRTMPQLRGSVQRFSTEIAAARAQDPSESETAALDSYALAVEALDDSLKLWAAKVEHGPTLSTDIEGVAPLKEKYLLPIDDSGKVTADDSLTVIWAKAEESLHAGNEFYAQ